MLLFLVHDIVDDMCQFHWDKSRAEVENKWKRDHLDDEGESDAKKMRQGKDGFPHNMARKTVNGHAPKMGWEYQR